MSDKVSARQIAARRADALAIGQSGRWSPAARHLLLGKPLALFLDLPAGVGPDAAQDQFRIAAWQKPWKSQAVFASPEDSGFVQRQRWSRSLPIIGSAGRAHLPPGVAAASTIRGSIDGSLFGGETGKRQPRAIC